jgi:predicted secreted Zn-dependent protease
MIRAAHCLPAALRAPGPAPVKLRLPAYAAILALGLATGVDTRAEVVETVHYSHYGIRFVHGLPLKAALNAASPVRREGQVFHAHTGWELRYELRWFEERDGRCAVTRVTTTLKADILLPLLEPGSTAGWPDWPGYLQALRGHEHGHLEIARAAAHLLDRRIAGLPQAISCGMLQAQARQAWREVLEGAGKEDREYDRRTDYGRTQGAGLP